MFMFRRVLFLSIFVAVIKSQKLCDKEYSVPIEGFKRKNCIPGHYDGSCLVLISQPMKFIDAYSTCYYQYGGRLATADSEIVFKKWIRRIYRDLTFEVNETTRFWVGYGKDAFYESTPVGKDIFDETAFPWAKSLSVPKGSDIVFFYDMIYWNKSFHGKNLKINLPWEEGVDWNFLDNDPCSSYATVFNPNNAKFSIRSVEESHPFLCETPRYPKIKCSTGWHLNPKNRMCIFYNRQKANYYNAVAGCRSKEAFPAIAADYNEYFFFSVITAYYGKSRSGDLVWGGLKQSENEAYTLDGTKSLITSKQETDICTAYYGSYHVDRGSEGIASGFDCPNEKPYMCQRFVDQAFTLNVE